MSKDDSNPNPNDTIDWIKGFNINEQASKGNPSFSYSMPYWLLFKGRSDTIHTFSGVNDSEFIS